MPNICVQQYVDSQEVAGHRGPHRFQTLVRRSARSDNRWMNLQETAGNPGRIGPQRDRLAKNGYRGIRVGRVQWIQEVWQSSVSDGY